MEEREAVRVILLDPAGRTLLFRGDDYWFTPSGGLDPGETLEQAGRREVLEEVGLTLDGLGPPVHRDQVQFWVEGQGYRQQQTFFVVRVPRLEVDCSGWTDIERRTIGEVRWWSPAEIAETSERIYPENLLELLRLG